MLLPEPRAYSPQALNVGMSAEFEREITEEDVLTFARNSGDFNPLHVSDDYARGTTFQKRIVHGAFQVGLASAMLGMYLPGREALLGGINARFVAPLYFPNCVRVRGEITAWSLPSLAGSLKVVIKESATLAPTAEIHLGFTFHQSASPKNIEVSSVARSYSGSDRHVVLVTGAAGEMGEEIASDLSDDHFVIAMFHRKPLTGRLRDVANILEIQADLCSPDWEGRVKEALGNNPLYAIVHAAWPGAPRGGLLGSADEVIEQQLSFATVQTIRLSRFLLSAAPQAGGRLIALGSLSGGQKPQISIAPYSMAKAALEQTVRLLAPELARKKVTINTICPSSAGVGMHKHVNDNQKMKEAALVPMGRVCTLADVTGTVRFLLSPHASFISGQAIALSGAQL
jgi:NAD(P)-dependent dehydrogenase (short-subunit alcohol dehydrogenase family)/acyl dehydratase